MKLKDSTIYVNKPGSKTKPIYSSKVEDDGTILLVETGKEDFYGYVQSFKDSVDINVLMKKYMNGDIAALERVQGFYADITGFPKNNAELLQRIIDGEKTFNALPTSVKEKFDNDFNRWFSTMDSNEWFEKMSFHKEAVAETEKEEVKSE